MARTHTIQRVIRPGTGTSTRYEVDASGGKEINVSENLIDDATTSVACVIDQSALQSLVIATDTDCTLLAKNGGSTVDTYTMKADRPIVWVSGDSLACPLSGDITAFSATLSGVGANIALTVFALVDPTP